MQSEHIF